MKKIKIVFLITIITLMMSGCQSKDVKNVVKECFDQYQTGNILEAEKYMNGIDSESNLMELKEPDLKRFSKAFSKLTYKIGKIKIEDNKAVVKISLNVKNLNQTNSKFIDEIFRLSIVEEKSGWEIEALLPELYDDFLNESDFVDVDLDLNLEKIEEIWKINPTFEFKDAITGGLYKAVGMENTELSEE